ncbi:MAG TPA: ATP-binding cassette domain-containing protein [Acetobacteraceae bacterium]|nr:ATP-binding cassette domain-containing protein [Acetobacteraceae bacterium]
MTRGVQAIFPNSAGGRVVLRSVTVRYGRRLALESISGEFAPGSLTAVVGANGAGKSTLLASIAGTVRLSRGRIERNGALSYLPQRASLDIEFPLTVAELITLGAWHEIGSFGAPSPGLRAKAAAAADVVGLSQHLSRRIGELSIGELQRALFARLTMQDAPTILLDEPLAAVDAGTGSVLLDVIERWHREGRTVIAVLHDLELVRTRFPQTIVLAQRCIAWGPTNSALQEMAVQ